MERKLLQTAVAFAGLFAIAFGLTGAISGAAFMSLASNLSVDSYVRLLSGILLAIGLLLLASLPRIEQHGQRFSALAFILVIGGLARLLGVISHGVPTQGIMIGLSMELIVAPLLWLWQRRIARIHAAQVYD